MEPLLITIAFVVAVMLVITNDHHIHTYFNRNSQGYEEAKIKSGCVVQISIFMIFILLAFLFISMIHS